MKTTITQTIKTIVLVSLFLLNMARINYAQESSLQFEIVALPDKDISSHIVNLTQDSTGFLWFASSDGLYRYDGYSFTNFSHDPQDPTSLSSNEIESLYVDRKGTLWAGTVGYGLNKFHPETESFTHFRNDPQNPHSLSSDTVRVITEDHFGQLWVGTTNGLSLLDRNTKTVNRYNYDPNDTSSLGNDEVRSLYVDSQGTLWIGTIAFTQPKSKPGPGGLNRFNHETGTFTRYLHDPEDPNSLMSNRVISMYEDSRGDFWVGTHGNVLHKMDRETGKFERLIYDTDNPGTLQSPSEGSLPDSCVDYDCGGITFIDEDSSGRLWIGFSYEGLILYDPELESYTHFAQRLNDPSSPLEEDMWKIHPSKDGARWITALGSPDVIKVTTSTQPIIYENTITVNTLYLDTSGSLWVSRSGGIDTFNYSTDMMDSNPYQRNNLISYIPYGVIGSVFQSMDGTIWFGSYEGPSNATGGGLFRLVPDKNELSLVFNDSDIPEYIGPIIQIYEDPDGIFWLATEYTGLFRFERKTNTLTQYLHEPTNPNSLSHNSLTEIHSSKANPRILWIGTEQGLNRFDTETETFTRYLHDSDNPNSLAGEFVRTIYEDAQNRLWIGTHSGGLSQFDVSNNQFKQYTIYNSGLPSNNVVCILGSPDGSLWMGTDQQLTHFDPSTELFYTYNENHGVLNIPFFDDCAANPEGEFIFSVRNGFMVFDPDQIITNTTPTPVLFTNLFLENQPVDFGPDSPLKAPLWLTDEIHLSFLDNTFSMEFSGLDFRDPEVNQYAYKLDGYNEEWIGIGTARRANFENIPSGEYTFHVRAANSNGVWDVDGASIGITILPPWWQTWWAYGLYALIFAAGVFAVDRFQRRRLIKKEQEKARERELEQAKEIEKAYHNLEVAHENLKSAQEQLVQQEKLASLGQLTAGIAHEIKNPLNFVNNFSDLSIELVEEVREEVKRQKADVSSKNSPLERSVEVKRRRGVSDEATNHNLILDILDDVEMNLKKIHEHGTRADGIVKSMLQHSRGGDGKMEPTPLNPLIKEYVNLAFHGMRAGKQPINVDIELDLDKNIGEVDMITEDFSRVILNLCNNAFDAMREKLSENAKGPDGSGLQNTRSKSEKALSPNPSPEGEGRRGEGEYSPKLIVRTHQKDKTVTIEIEDNGPGIPKEIKDKILQPFFTTKKGTAGTGLGLSITNDIIKAHGGSLDIKSSKQRGSTFTITLNPS